MPKKMTKKRRLWEDSGIGSIIAIPVSENEWVLMRKIKGTFAVFPIVFDHLPSNAVQRLKRSAPKWYLDYMPLNEPQIGCLLDVWPFADGEDWSTPPHYHEPSYPGDSFWIIRDSISRPCAPEDVKGLPRWLGCVRPSTIGRFFRDWIDKGEMQRIHVPEGERFQGAEAHSAGAEVAAPPEEAESDPRVEARAAAAAARSFRSAGTYRQALAVLARCIRRLDDGHPEISDTDIRERMWDVVVHGHFYRTPGYDVPHGFNTDSPEADAKVRAVLGAFCDAANRAAESEGLDTPAKRHAAFNSRPELELDEFFGWSEELPPAAAPIPGTAEAD